eukprot:5922399-Alexandrium_andersonii.AAC.1
MIPYSTTPVFSFLDVEYADETVIVAKSRKTAQTFLRVLQQTARTFGLELNKTKTVHLQLNSELDVQFDDDTIVPVATQTKYLGVIIQSNAGYEFEAKH